MRMMGLRPQYRYRAKVVRVVDGDTFDVNLDLGFGVWLRRQRLRLEGIDTPKIRGKERPEGLIAKQFVEEALLPKEHTTRNHKVIVETFKDKMGKYGCLLAVIWYAVRRDEFRNLNVELVEKGLAERVEY